MLNTLTVIAVAMLLTVHQPAFAGEWQNLFDGESLDGWKASKENTQFKIVNGVILGSSSNKTHFLFTNKEYRDFELELEAKIHDTDLNSGVQFRTSTSRANDKGDLREVIHGPQLDLGKSPGRSGCIYGQGNGGWITPEKDLVRNSHMKNGEWNKVRIVAVGRTVQTWINDEQVSDFKINDDIHKRYPQGVIALQVHGVKKSPEIARHVSFRAIRIRNIENASRDGS